MELSSKNPQTMTSALSKKSALTQSQQAPLLAKPEHKKLIQAREVDEGVDTESKAEQAELKKKLKLKAEKDRLNELAREKEEKEARWKKEVQQKKQEEQERQQASEEEKK